MSNQSVSVTVINGKGVLETLSLVPTNTQRIHAVSSARYLLSSTDNVAAVQSVNFKRVGKDLHLTLEGSDLDHPEVIIEGFYDHPGEVVGMAPDGEVYPYTAVSGDSEEVAVLLQDGATSPQTLGREPLSGFMADLQGAEGVFWKQILSGLGAAAALAWLLHDKGGSKSTPPPPPPSLESVHSHSDSDLRVVERGGLTADSTPVLSGVGVPGGQVEIYKGSESLGVVPVSAEGYWRFTPSLALADGHQLFSVVAIDDNGQRSAASATYEIEIDATPPPQPKIAAAVDNKGITVGGIADGLHTNDVTPTLSGSAEAGSLVTIYNGSDILGSARVDADGHWLFTVPEQVEGEHRFAVIASDAAGNTSGASEVYAINIDTTPPSVLIRQVADNVGAINDPLSNPGRTDDTAPTISGTTEAGALVTIYDNGEAIGSIASDTQGNWSFSVPERADGRHQFTVTATDDAGNISPMSSPWIVEIDTSLPVASITHVTDDTGAVTGSVTNGGRTDDTTPTLHGVATSNALVTVHDGKSEIGSVYADANGVWSFPVPSSADGTHNFSVAATNDVGTTGLVSEEWVVEIDTDVPGVPKILSVYDDAGGLTGNVPRSGITDDSTPTVKGIAEIGSVITVYDGGVILGTALTDGSGAWSLVLPELLPGSHDLIAVARNDIGISSDVSNGFDFKVGATWDFNDKTLQGWKLAGRYGTDTTSTYITDDGHGGRLIAALTENGGDWGGTVMSIKVQVEAGVTYQFTFTTGQQLISNEVTASLGLMVDGVATGTEVKAAAGSHKFFGSFTATSTGSVTLSINNSEHSGTGNDFWLDDLAMARVEATGPANLGDIIFNVLQEESPLLEAPELILNSSDISRNALILASGDVLAPGENDLFKDAEFAPQQMLVEREALVLLNLGAFPGLGDEGVDLGAVNVAGVVCSGHQQSTLHSDSLLREVDATSVT